MKKRLALLLVLVSLFTVAFASVSSFAATEGGTTVEDTYNEGVGVFTQLTDFISQTFTQISDLAKINYTGTASLLETKINELLAHFQFELPVGMPMLILSILVLIVGLCFFFFGTKTWKILLRIAYYVIAYYVGYYGFAAVMHMLPALQELPFSGYYPIACGVLLGLIGCIFTSFCLRLSLFMGCIGAAYIVLPMIITPLFDPAYIFSPELLMICYLTLGAIVGYLVAFRFQRLVLILGSIAFAGLGITFALFQFFLATVFTNVSLSVDLYYWIVSGAIAFLALILSAIRSRKRRAKERNLALEAL